VKAFLIALIVAMLLARHLLLVPPAAAVSSHSGRIEQTSSFHDHARRWVFRALRALALVVILVAVLLLLEEHAIYHPSRYPEGEWQPAIAGLEDCFFQTADGVRLHAWWVSAVQDADGPVLLWFHGNAGNITHRADNLAMLAGSDLGVLLVDYRGYGRSEGRPSERGIYADGEAAYDYLTRARGVEPRRIVCFGRSLGTAVALHVATVRPVSGLILETPFTSARDMARRMMPILPIWPLIRTKMDNVERVRRLRVPLLVIHGDRDEVVPFEQGKAVFDAAPEPKEFLALKGAAHNDTYLVGGAPYIDKVRDFCRQCVRGAALQR
jgi:fermentation-respiration switch protein FrsA (DUF1100 family)